MEHRHQSTAYPSQEELGRHRGEWVVVEAGKIIASGTDPRAVLAEARTMLGNRVPFIFRVPTGEVMIL